MILLREQISPDNLQFIKEDEDIGGGQKEKVYRLKGIMLQSDIKNLNSRIYPKPIIEREVKTFNEKIKTRRAVGTCDHGETPNIELDRISHVIESLVMDGANGIGVARIIDTPCGKVIKSLIDGGVVLGMSSRAVGSLDENGVVKEDLSIISLDCVLTPSAPDAIVEALVESTEWALNGDKWVKVCKDGKCKLVKTTSINESTVNIMGYDWDVEVIDSTHIKYKIAGTDKWAIPQHIGQLSNEMKDKLEAAGVIKDGSFVTSSTPVSTESVVEAAVKNLKEDVDRNASSKYYLNYMTNFIDTINGKTR